MGALVRGSAAAAGFAALVVGAGCADDSPTSPRSESRRGLNGIGPAASVSLTINPNATVLPGGERLILGGQVTCDPVGHVDQPLEALVFASQNHQRVQGEGGLGGFGCNGELQPYTGLVQAFDGHFRPGPAFVSAFVLVCNEAGSVCEQGQASRTVMVRRP